MLAGLEAFDATVRGWFEAVEDVAAEAAVGLAKDVFDKVLDESPQSSADFVANWRVSLNVPDPTFTLGVIKPPVKPYANDVGIHEDALFGKGSPEGIAYAKSHAVWPKMKLGDKIFISNSASHDEDYAMKIEDGKVKFRPINQGSDHVAARSLNFVAHRYPTINKASLKNLIGLGV